MSTDPGITYTVKELLGMLERTLNEQLGQVARRLDAIEQKLDDRATNTRAQALELRLQATEERVGRLELSIAGHAAVTKFQRWVFNIVWAGAAATIATLIYYAMAAHP